MHDITVSPWDLVWAGWLALFGILEVVALVVPGCPWQPLSDFTWSIENAWHPFGWIILVGFALLTAHLAFQTGWPK